jgi:D-alanyl-D-alanine carboxypeptidase
MRRRLFLRAALGSLIFAFMPNRSAAAAQGRYAAVVIDALSGDVLYEESADARRFPASLTKIMTLYMLFDAIRGERLTMDDVLTASSSAAMQPASRLGLLLGDRLSVESAIYALVVWSANDVATVIAERLGGSESRFASLMTVRARELGLTSTRFANASGLPDPAHATTARDMARLARAIWYDFPEFYRYFQTPAFTWDSVRVRNHNHLLRRVDGVDGIKTGYTRASGFNIAASAQRDGRRVIAVVMGGGTAAARDAQAAQLIDTAFNELTSASAVGTAIRGTL